MERGLALDGGAAAGRGVTALERSAGALEVAAALTGDREAVEACLAGLQPAHLGGVGAAARALLLGGGKRVRPLVTCAVARACGGDPRPLMLAVAAVELVHAASLLHDDIIDGATTRRGGPAGHAALGVHGAVLAGDYLVACAFEDLCHAGQPALQGRLSRAVRDLCEGEVLERARLFDATTDRGHARLVNRLKTASLFAYAAEAGALLAGAGPAAAAGAREYGDALGQAFQITDDVLDWDGSAGVLGKPVGQDLAQGAMTVPVALALEVEPGLRDAVAACWAVRGDPAAPARLAAVADGVRRTGALAAARDLARGEARRARQALLALPAGPWRDRLERMAEEVIERSV